MCDTLLTPTAKDDEITMQLLREEKGKKKKENLGDIEGDYKDSLEQAGAKT